MPTDCSQRRISELAIPKKRKENQHTLCLYWATNAHPLLLATEDQSTLSKEHTGSSSSDSSYNADTFNITKIAEVTELIFAFYQRFKMTDKEC